MEPVHTFEHAGLTVEIFYDEFGGEHANPRDWAQIGTMVCWHPNYALGDYQITNPDGRGAVNEHRSEARGRYDDRFERDDFRSLPALARWLSLTGKAHLGVVLPLALYEHSGITMRVGHHGSFPSDSAGWDTSDSGYIFASRDKIAELCGEDHECMTDPDALAKALRTEVDEYAMYLEGQVYGFVIRRLAEDEDGNEGAEIDDLYPGIGALDDSCWGFLGHESVEEAAKEAANDVRRAIDTYLANERTETCWAAKQGIVTTD